MATYLGYTPVQYGRLIPGVVFQCFAVEFNGLYVRNQASKMDNLSFAEMKIGSEEIVGSHPVKMCGHGRA